MGKGKERKGHKSYGKDKHPLYETWRGMIQRCYSVNRPNCKYYGARGITVCKEWLSDFIVFVEDMGKKPTDSHTLERKDNSGNYNKDNCVWATKTEQGLNRRKNYNATSKHHCIHFCNTHKQWILKEPLTHKNLGHFNSEQEAVGMKIVLEDRYPLLVKHVQKRTNIQNGRGLTCN